MPELSDNNENQGRSRANYVGLGLALGAGTGTAFGAAFGNVGLGVAFGTAFGIILGAALSGRCAKRATSNKRMNLSVLPQLPGDASRQFALWPAGRAARSTVGWTGGV